MIGERDKYFHFEIRQSKPFEDSCQYTDIKRLFDIALLVFLVKNRRHFQLFVFTCAKRQVMGRFFYDDLFKCGKLTIESGFRSSQRSIAVK